MRKLLSNSEKRDLNKTISIFDFEVTKKDRVEILEDDLVFINAQACFFYHEGKVLPTLRFVLEQDPPQKKVIVDMGAVKFVVSGADIMRPGIVSTDSFEKGEPVVVVDEKNSKPLAIGISMYSSEEIASLKNGKVIHNIHHVSDRIWQAQA